MPEPRVIILAAGESRRMGEVKPLLSLGPESVLERVIRVFVSAGLERPVIVVAEPHAAMIAKHVSALDVEVVHNPDPAAGPISSLRCGLNAVAACAGVFVHPADIPGVELHDIRTILRVADEEPSADAVIPSVSMRRAHPVFLRPLLVEQVRSGAHATLRDVLNDSRWNIAYAITENRLLRADLDTQEDYEQLLRHLPPPDSC